MQATRGNGCHLLAIEDMSRLFALALGTCGTVTLLKALSLSVESALFMVTAIVCHVHSVIILSTALVFKGVTVIQPSDRTIKKRRLTTSDFKREDTKASDGATPAHTRRASRSTDSHIHTHR